VSNYLCFQKSTIFILYLCLCGIFLSLTCSLLCSTMDFDSEEDEGNTCSFIYSTIFVMAPWHWLTCLHDFRWGGRAGKSCNQSKWYIFNVCDLCFAIFFLDSMRYCYINFVWFKAKLELRRIRKVKRRQLLQLQNQVLL
jgi:hypothetical protein